MELLFPKVTIPCLRQVKDEVQTIEETQELRMPEEYPDIGKILGSWGQVLLRGKEWRDGSMAVSGGVMTWILYQAEGENAELCTVEAWIPFQMKWDLPPTQHDGSIHVVPLLRSVDARTTSARKMVARVTVSLLGEAYVQDEVHSCTPAELPEDIHLLQQSYPMLLPKEAGEKAFDMEEELSLPASCPRIDRIIRFQLQPELIDQKVLSGKLVFRGTAIVHLLYQSVEGQLCTWDFDVPFSRYAELDDQYEQEARSSVTLAVTSLELQEEADGILRLKAGLTGQYMIYDKAFVTVGQDAYSTNRDIQLDQEIAEFPAVLELQQNTVTAECSGVSSGRIIDAAFYPDHPQLQKNHDGTKITLTGQFHVLAENEQQLTGSSHKCSCSWDLPAEDNVDVSVTVVPSGKPDTAGTLRADMLVEAVSTAKQRLQMISSIEAGPILEADPERPSLIIRRAGKETLWQIAKGCGSTVESICKINHLQQEPEPSQLLLIPIA